jgi:O-antigen/teichoic acid export membrane protein
MMGISRVNRTENLFGRSLKAMGWGYGGVAIGVFLQIVNSIVFARMLGPQITGVFAFGLLVFPPFRFICEFGLGSALVEKSVLDAGDVQMAFSRSIMLAIATAVAWLLCIQVLAPLMSQRQYLPELDCFALVLLCLPIQTVCAAVLTKQLEQKYLIAVSFVAYAAGYMAIGTYGALHNWKVWSLILGFLAQNLLTTLLLLAHTKIDLKPRFKGDANFLWRFGARATAINISTWLTSGLDNMAVAWYSGTRTLGVYSTAYGLVRASADKIVTTLQSVLFPASVLARDDGERLKKGSIAAIDAVFMLAAPAFCSVALLSKTIVEALYGPAWNEAASVLPPFALSMVPHCLAVITSALLWGTGGVNRDLRLQWSAAAVLLLAVIVAGRYSFVAIAWITVPVTAFRAIWGTRALMATVGIGLKRMMRGFLGGAVLVIFISPTLYMIDNYMSGNAVPAITRLTGDVLAGGILWLGLTALLYGRLMTPELLAGLHSLRIAMGKGKQHA